MKSTVTVMTAEKDLSKVPASQSEGRGHRLLVTTCARLKVTLDRVELLVHLPHGSHHLRFHVACNDASRCFPGEPVISLEVTVDGAQLSHIYHRVVARTGDEREEVPL